MWFGPPPGSRNAGVVISGHLAEELDVARRNGSRASSDLTCLRHHLSLGISTEIISMAADAFSWSSLVSAVFADGVDLVGNQPMHLFVDGIGILCATCLETWSRFSM